MYFLFVLLYSFSFSSRAFVNHLSLDGIFYRTLIKVLLKYVGISARHADLVVIDYILIVVVKLKCIYAQVREK
jgi:hypothetical protein